MKLFENSLIDFLEEILKFPLTTVTEEKTKVVVPDLSKYKRGDYVDPSWAPVFYNPVMKMCRDLSVAAILAYSKSYSPSSSVSVCEPLCATGVRGIRYVTETNVVEYLLLNDIDERAALIAVANTLLNSIDDLADVFNLDANILLALSRKFTRFNVVDIDPFGSPEPFIGSALKAITHKGLLCLTATDLAPLTGAHRAACLRRYFSVTAKTDCGFEIASRILYYGVIKHAAPLNMGVKPLLTFKGRHYIRCFLQIFKSRKAADETISRIGYALYCSKCGYRELSRNTTTLKCRECGGQLEKIGPLWIGKIFDTAFCDEVLNEIKCLGLSKSLTMKLETILSESDINKLYYTTENISRVIKMNEISPRVVVNELIKRGFKASLTHFDFKGFRTNASYNTLLKFIKDLSSLLHEIS
ncbi:MAG: tRNA (guanine(10)-N(2))-dimethyltransferase [Thermoprotei archaeon]|nr:MAG: tRNA (guanine(10)-N(2))-dimethyltransferase [Thermoprotei archaeon]